jgi:hypothetical protein
MSSKETSISLPGARILRGRSRRALTLLLAASILSLLSSQGILAQQHFKRTYPVQRNVRLALVNQSGTIVVEGWDRDAVRITAEMYSPVARITPELSGDGFVINVMRANRGRDEVGEVNFRIMVPVNSTVDLQTRRGDIKVNNIRGTLVRAHVGSEGDVELTEIHASTVMASNTMGNILFDGELASDGSYEFKCGQGDINIRIPAGSAFRLVATAPFSRNINVDAFWNDGLRKVGDGRKIEGDVGGGRPMPLLTVTNYRGGISFIRR